MTAHQRQHGGVPARGVPLAACTDPRLARARGLLAAEEALAPLGMDVLALDLEGSPST